MKKFRSSTKRILAAGIAMCLLSTTVFTTDLIKMVYADEEESTTVNAELTDAELFFGGENDVLEESTEEGISENFFEEFLEESTEVVEDLTDMEASTEDEVLENTETDNVSEDTLEEGEANVVEVTEDELEVEEAPPTVEEIQEVVENLPTGDVARRYNESLNPSGAYSDPAIYDGCYLDEDGDGYTWRESTRIRNLYYDEREKSTIGIAYHGETINEVLQMIDDPSVNVDLDSMLRSTVFKGATKEDLTSWSESGYTFYSLTKKVSEGFYDDVWQYFKTTRASYRDGYEITAISSSSLHSKVTIPYLNRTDREFHKMSLGGYPAFCKDNGKKMQNSNQVYYTQTSGSTADGKAISWYTKNQTNQNYEYAQLYIWVNEKGGDKTSFQKAYAQLQVSAWANSNGVTATSTQIKNVVDTAISTNGSGSVSIGGKNVPMMTIFNYYNGASSYWNGIGGSSVAKTRVYKINTPDAGYGESDYQRIVTGYLAPEAAYCYVQKVSTRTDLLSYSSYDASGARYNIFNNATGEWVKTVSTYYDSATGTYRTETVQVSPGTYRIQEEAASAGHGIDGEVHYVTVSAGETKSVVSYEPAVTGSFQLHKSSANPSITNGNKCYSLEGAEYTLTDEKGISYILTTDKNGNSNILTGLPIGNYRLQETKSPLGYKIDTQAKDITVTGGTNDYNTTDEPLNDPLKISINKVDANGNKVEGNASLEGAEFTIYYYDSTTVNLNSLPSDLNASGYTKKWTIKTIYDSTIKKYEARLDNAHFVSGDSFYYDDKGGIVTPLGSYVITETKAPTGYMIAGNTISVDGVTSTNNRFIVHITQNGTVAKADVGNQAGNVLLQTEQVKRGGFDFIKVDKELFDKGLFFEGTDLTKLKYNGQGEAVILHATYDLYNRSANAVVVDGNTYQPNQVVMTCTTNDKSAFSSGTNKLPYGTYELVERVAPDAGYNIGNKYKFSITEQDQMVHIVNGAIHDEVMRGGLKVQKYDEETKTKTPQGALSFKDITFEIVSRNSKPVIVNDNVYYNGDVVTTISLDDNGAANLGTILPYGNYTIREKDVPYATGYLKEGVIEKDFSITSQGQIVDLYSTYSKAVSDYAYRTDFELKKVDKDTFDAMPNVEFDISLLDNAGNKIETHRIVTDENGEYHSASSYVSHSDDKGIWFGNDTPDDTKGALICGTYLVEEIKGEYNKKMEMLSDTFTVEIPTDYETEGVKQIDLGVWVNYEIRIKTHAKDMSNELQFALPSETTHVIDVVDYENLPTGTNWTLVAKVYDKTTGEFVKDELGNEIEGTYTWDNEEEYSQVEVPIDFDSTGLVGDNLVIYEYLYNGTRFVKAWENEDDVDEMLYYTSLSTNATDKSTGTHITYIAENATIIDEVYYVNLPLEEVTITGILMDKEDGKAVKDADGNVITATKTFTPTERVGTESLEFNFDASSYANKTFVVFESVTFSGDDKVIAEHTDIEDEAQTIHFAEVGTVAAITNYGEEDSLTDETIVVVEDEVEYKNLLANGEEYTLLGYFVSKEDGEIFTDIDGNPVEVLKTFTPGEPNGSEVVTFNIKKKSFTDVDYVVYEELYLGSYESKEDIVETSLVAKHTELESETQQVLFPYIKTTACDFQTGEGVSLAEEDALIYDYVFFDNLEIGKEYTVKGKLVNVEDGSPILVDGKEVEGETTFTAEDVTGTVVVEFTLDASALEGTTINVYEELWTNNGEKDFLLNEHKDLIDDKQTIYIPQIRTQLDNTINDTKMLVAEGEVEFVDTVTYTGLRPDITYVLKAVLVDKETEEPLMVDGEVLVATQSFTPLKPDGEAKVTFKFDASVLQGKTYVCYERCYRNDNLVALHCDIDSIEQTQYFSDCITTAQTADGDKTILAGDESNYKNGKKNTQKFIDTVEFKNLEPNETYNVYGKLMVKETGEPLLDEDGNEVTASGSFKPKERDGFIELEFSINAYAIPKTTLVVYERIYLVDEEKGEEILVAKHENINSIAQSIYIEDKIGWLVLSYKGTGKTGKGTRVNGTKRPKTGDRPLGMIFGTMGFGIGLLMIAFALMREKKKKLPLMMLLLLAGAIAGISIGNTKAYAATNEDCVVYESYTPEEQMEFPETKEIDGKTYKLVKVKYDLLGKHQISEADYTKTEETKVNYRYDEEVNPSKTIEEDGVVYTLKGMKRLDDKKIEFLLGGYKDYYKVVTEKDVPASMEVEEKTEDGLMVKDTAPLIRIYEPDNGTVIVEEIRLTNYNYQGEDSLWIGGQAIPVDPKNPIAGFERDVLLAEELDPSVFTITGSKWVGEPYEEDGETVRDVSIEVRSVEPHYRAEYEIGIDLFPYELTYEDLSLKAHDGEYLYEIQATAVYRHGLSVAVKIIIIILIALLLLALLVFLILLLTKKKKKKNTEEEDKERARALDYEKEEL